MKWVLPLILSLLGFQSVGAGERLVLDFQGYAWESGSFPPSAAGETLSIPCVVNQLSDVLGIDLQNEEVTGWITDLVSQGSTDLGAGVTATRYGTGTVHFYRDASRDHLFAMKPPNGEVPATFVNGTLCLGGTLEDFVLYFDANTGSGAFEAQVSFTAGDCLAALQALRAEGFTFGGVLSPTAAAGNVPEGYDLQVDGLLEAEGVGETCPFECLALTEAQFMFPRDVEDGFAFSTSAFRLHGAFTPCSGSEALDPGSLDVTVQVGMFQQTLPAGSLVADRKGRERWRFRAPNHFGEITELLLERDGRDGWRFEIAGRRQPRALLLPRGPEVELHLVIGTSEGTTREELRERKKKLFFRGDSNPCGSKKHKKAEPLQPAPATPTAGIEMLPLSPNPFNAQVLVRLRVHQPGAARLELFDARGRTLRLLTRGSLTAGEHAFQWDGRDARGVPQSSGIYFVRLTTADGITTRKLVMAK